LLCGSAYARRAEHLILSSGNIIAAVECYVLSLRVDSTRIYIQSAFRSSHQYQHSHNRGAAGDFIDSMQSGDITLKLTRRPTRATIRMKPANEHERQAKGGRVE
jgi:hypothetical protein